MIASLIQFTMPGAPTIYYGDEVGVTGDDDPDDRRTYPWTDAGANPDNAMFKHYQTLSLLRKLAHRRSRMAISRCCWRMTPPKPWPTGAKSTARRPWW